MKILSVYAACTLGPDGKRPTCDYISEGVAPHDVRLFEAAPEILECLEYFVAFHTPGSIPERFGVGQMQNRLAQARAAIKRVRGD